MTTIHIEDDNGVRKLPAFRIGKILYLCNRRKGNKYPTLYRWDEDDHRAVRLARFTNNDEAEIFWNLFVELARDYDALMRVTVDQIAAYGDYLDTSIIEQVRQAGAVRDSATALGGDV